jgi:hypothetical protein
MHELKHVAFKHTAIASLSSSVLKHTHHNKPNKTIIRATVQKARPAGEVAFLPAHVWEEPSPVANNPHFNPLPCASVIFGGGYLVVVGVCVGV